MTGIVKNIRPYGAFIEIGGRLSRLDTYRRYICCKNKKSYGKIRNWTKNKSYDKISGGRFLYKITENNTMKNTKKGFTLVELLVVIAILAILATVAVVGYTSFTRKAELKDFNS